MPRETKNEVTAGLFTVFALAVLVGVIFWLGASDIFRKAGQTAWFFINEGEGKLALQPDGQVLVNDVVVGRITAIQLDSSANRTMYQVKLYRDDIKIYSDGEAQVSAALVGGANLVIVNRGNESAGEADRHNPIHIQVGMFDQALKKVDKVSEHISQLTTRLVGELDKEDPRSVLGKVHSMLDELSVAFHDAALMIESAKGEMDPENKEALLAKMRQTVNTLAELASTAQPVIVNTLNNVDAMVTDVKPKVETTAGNLQEITDRLKKYTDEDIADILLKLRKANNNILTISENFAKISGEAKEMFMIHRDNLDEMFDNLTKVSGDLKAASSEIRRNPWKLLYQPKKGELHSQNIFDAAREFSSGAAQLDQTVSKLSGLIKAYPDGVPNDAPQLKEINTQLKEAFSRFSEAEQSLWKELK